MVAFGVRRAFAAAALRRQPVANVAPRERTVARRSMSLETSEGVPPPVMTEEVPVAGLAPADEAHAALRQGPSAAAATAEKPGRRQRLTVESAASTTSFAAKVALLAPFLGLTTAAALLHAPTAVAAGPFAILTAKFVKREPGESAARHAFKICGLASTWSAWAIGLAWAPLYVALGVPLGPWHALAIYAPLVVIARKKSRDDHFYSPASTAVLRVSFDAPLVLTALWLRHFFHIRLFAPFATVLDEDLVQGTMPLTAADVEILKNEPYNVGAVVNMCAEWPGPVAAYAAAGIVQCRLPFQDTCSPDADALRRGAAFVDHQLRTMPDGKRVFVHCKGGIARASTMSLAHYIINKGRRADEAIEHIKALRPIVMRSVTKYAAIRDIGRDIPRPRHNNTPPPSSSSSSSEPTSTNDAASS